MKWLSILVLMAGCSGGHLESDITPPAHIVRVWPECAVLSGVLLDFSGLEHTDGAYWFGTFSGDLIGSRIDGASCDQTFELEPCNPGIGWCPSVDAGMPEAAPAPLPLCVLTPNDLKNGIGISVCSPGIFVCYGEFVTPEAGCLLHPGTDIGGTCVRKCP